MSTTIWKYLGELGLSSTPRGRTKKIPPPVRRPPPSRSGAAAAREVLTRADRRAAAPGMSPRRVILLRDRISSTHIRRNVGGDRSELRLRQGEHRPERSPTLPSRRIPPNGHVRSVQYALESDLSQAVGHEPGGLDRSL